MKLLFITLSIMLSCSGESLRGQAPFLFRVEGFSDAFEGSKPEDLISRDDFSADFLNGLSASTSVNVGGMVQNGGLDAVASMQARIIPLEHAAEIELTFETRRIHDHFGDRPSIIRFLTSQVKISAYILGGHRTPYQYRVVVHPAAVKEGAEGGDFTTLTNPGSRHNWSNLAQNPFALAGSLTGISRSETIVFEDSVYSRIPLEVEAKAKISYGNTGPVQDPFSRTKTSDFKVSVGFIHGLIPPPQYTPPKEFKVSFATPSQTVPPNVAIQMSEAQSGLVPVLSWKSSAGEVYEIQRSTNLLNWTRDAFLIEGKGETTSIQREVGNEDRVFWRLVRLR
ncbi:MAG: hypothetical protein AAGA96_20065 [Verrucomicrobiota bacterium]